MGTQLLRRAAITALAILTSLANGTAWAGSPVAQDDTIFVTSRYREGNSYRVIVDVLANDHDPDGKPLRIDIDSLPLQPTTVDSGIARGTLTHLDDGTLVYEANDYQPDEPFEPVSFSYRLSGAGGQAKVTLTTPGVIFTPSDRFAVVDDGITINPSTTSATVDVLKNDQVADVIDSVTQGQKGTTSITADNRVRYTPGSSFTSGQDQFQYQASYSGDQDLTGSANVTVTIVDETTSDPFPVVLHDDFDDMALDATLFGRSPQVNGTRTSWDGTGTHELDAADLSFSQHVITNQEHNGSVILPRLAFSPDSIEARDYEIEAKIRIDGTFWEGVAFGRENMNLFACGDSGTGDLRHWLQISARLTFEGDLILRNGCFGNSGTDIETRNYQDPTAPFAFDPSGLNDIRLRVEASCPNFPNSACISAWVNGARVVDRLKYFGPNGEVSPTPNITQAGLIIKTISDPVVPAETIAFDDVTVRAGRIQEPGMHVIHDGVEYQSGDQIDLGDVWSCPPELTDCDKDLVRIYPKNLGNSDLILANVSVGGDSAWSKKGAPARIAPGEIKPIGLFLNRRSSGVKRGNLSFDTNDPEAPAFSLDLTATIQEAGSPPIAVDDFLVLPIQLQPSLTIITGACSSVGDILCNDISTTGLIVDSHSGFSHGSQGGTGADGFVYNPDPGFIGNDSFQYHVTDAVGRSDSALVIIRVDGPPTASFDWNCDSGDCQLDATESEDFEDGTALASYVWNFGDGTVGTGSTVEHVFQASSTYAVRLSVQDSQGQSDTLTRQLETDFPPTASFTAQCADRHCTFDGGASSDDHGIVSLKWDFDDGSPLARGESVTHDYTESGDYLVALTATDISGQTDSATRPLHVDIHPAAAFTIDCDSLKCTFDASGSSDDFGIKSFAWDFGDGSTLSSQGLVSHVYPEEGFYSVSLTVRDTIDQKDSVTHGKKVYDEETFLLLIIDPED